MEYILYAVYFDDQLCCVYAGVVIICYFWLYITSNLILYEI